MEDYIFKTHFKMTYEEYKKMHNMSLKRHWLIYLVFILMPLLLTLEDIIKSNAIAVLLLTYMGFVVFAFVLLGVMRKFMYKRSARIRDFEQTSYFFEERFETDTPIAHIKLNYSDLFHVVETKTNFYLYLTWKSLLIVPKSDCSEENIEFLRTVAKSVNSKKKKFFS